MILTNMILTESMPVSASLLALLVNSAARATALAAVAAFGLAAFRVKATSARLFTWSAVLYAALAMPLLGWLLPPLPIPAPEFFQRTLNSAQAHAIFGSTNQTIVATEERSSLVGKNLPPDSTLAVAAKRRQNTAHGASRGENAPAANQPQRAERMALTENSNPALDSATPSPTTFSSLPWPAIAAATYLSVALLLLARFIIGLFFARRLLRASRPITDARVSRSLASRAAGLAHIPRVVESELISVPVTMGALRPTILLPTDWPAWDDAKLSAVLAHELSHVARRDGLTQRLSLLHRALFWFSPLAWWLDRHLALLAEQASDEAALNCGTDHNRYATILLEFFEALHAAPGRVWWPGVSMAKAGQAEERVDRILAWKGSVAMRLQKSIAVLVVVFAIPLVYLAASVHAANPATAPRAAQEQAAPPAQPAPAAKPSAAVSAEPAPTAEVAPPAEPGAPSQPPLPPSGGIYGVPPLPRAPVSAYAIDARANQVRAQAMAYAQLARQLATASRSGYSQSAASAPGRSYSYSYSFDDDQRFVIVTGKSDSLTMSGSIDDVHHIEKLRKSIPGDFLWFERDGTSYIIRDQAIIDRAKKLWAPQDELGRKQDELGKQQDALGKQQDELGAQMEKVRVNVPDLTGELDKLKAELKALGPNATMDQLSQLQSEMGDLQSKMGDIQSQAGEQQEKLGQQMEALGEKQEKLGNQQEELGRQQEEQSRKASEELKQILDEAIKKGTAQPEL
jgi:beta-lactamase regulating signal transducer with metallopeptidase domain